jgi:hypothetical protein
MANMRTFTTFIFSTLLASSAFSTESLKNITVKLGASSISVVVPDKKVRDLIVNELGETIVLQVQKDEDPQYIKDFESAKEQAKRGFLVQFLGDLIDIKAEALGSKKKSDLSSKDQVNLSAYATLREQISLNWLNEEAQKRSIQTTETDALSRLLGEVLTININKVDIAAFFKALAP